MPPLNPAVLVNSLYEQFSKKTLVRATVRMTRQLKAKLNWRRFEDGQSLMEGLSPVVPVHIMRIIALKCESVVDLNSSSFAEEGLNLLGVREGVLGDSGTVKMACNA